MRYEVNAVIEIMGRHLNAGKAASTYGAIGQSATSARPCQLEEEQRQHPHAEQGTKKCFSIAPAAIHSMLVDLVLARWQPRSQGSHVREIQPPQPSQLEVHLKLLVTHKLLIFPEYMHGHSLWPHILGKHAAEAEQYLAQILWEALMTRHELMLCCFNVALNISNCASVDLPKLNETNCSYKF